MSIFKKRTVVDYYDSIRKGDNTGGYSFIGWLIHKEKFYLLGFLANLLLGAGATYASWPEPVGVSIGLFFVIIAPSIIAYNSVKAYKRKKNR